MFRNKEIRYYFLTLLLFAVVASICGFWQSPTTGLLVMAVSAVFILSFYFFTGRRLRKISQISEQIDTVLHNAEQLKISDYEEGELSILQDELVKMTQRIRDQNQMLHKEKENLADSLADIAHQLRTPLTSVNLILSLLESTPDEKKKKVMIREAMDLLSRMDWLLTSLLKISRLDAGIAVFANEPISVAKLVHTALTPLSIQLELHNITLDIQIPDSIIINGDENWLSEVLQNIIKNSMEHLTEGGFIEITCDDNAIYTEMLIHDSGAGFAPEDLPFLFERFYRGKNAGTTGYGIGLALCRRIVTAQGGSITAKNHLAGGALFSIRFQK